MSEQQPFILVDGSSYLYRAFYAPPHLTNSKGEPTGAIYGVVGMLRSLIRAYHPSHMAVIFDAKGKTFRDDMYSEYKANRESMPDDLRSQIKPLHQIIKAMGLPLICVEGVEADDVIGTLATQADQQGLFTLISTGDKDMAQLVNKNIHLINTMTDTRLDHDGVIEKFGVPPEKIIDLLALTGDKSDNIPGLPGVGEKTALAMLQNLGGIETLYKKIGDIADLGFRGSKTMAKKLEEHKDILMLSQDLVTIRREVPLDVTVNQLTRASENQEELIKLYGELEFRKLLDEQLSNQSQDSAVESHNKTQTNYQCILTQQQLNHWIEKISKASYFAIDTETTSLDYMVAELVGISLSVKQGEAAYIPLQHKIDGTPKQLDLTHVLEQLKPILESKKHCKIGQNIKYDMSIFARYGIKLDGVQYDTMLESYVFNSIASRHNMNDLALKYLNKKTISFEDVAGKGAKQKTFDEIELEAATQYACEDADITLQLHENLWPRIEEDSKLKGVYQQVEQPLIHILSKIEREGVLIDTDKLRAQSQEISKKIKQLEARAYEIAGEEFNLSSTKQLQHIFFEKLHYPIRKKTPKGAPSTAEEVLIELSLDYPLPKVILEHRSLSKLQNTYIDKLPEIVHPETHRVHTNYHQAVTATGRLSSSNPNLQNIPIRSAEGRRIRNAFIAPKGYKILAADYSQVELRIMAHLSQDKNLLDAFINNQDIHKATASEVFDVPFDDVTSEQRRRAKAVNFGLIYGMSAFGLSKQLDIPIPDAQKYMDTYFERYPGVLNYMERTRQKAAEHGYVETLLGRRLYLNDIKASNRMRREAAERTAINAPMQGTAADIMKLAMIQVDKWLEKQTTGDIRMLMQVHDELVFEVRENFVEKAKKQIPLLMSEAFNIDVPLLVEADVGDSWEEAH